jgi:hypothetical protein
MSGEHRAAKARSGVQPRRVVNDLAAGLAKIQLADLPPASKTEETIWDWKTQSPPVREFSRPYTEQTLRPFEAKYYKAAGVMPLCWFPSQTDPSSKRLHTLLGIEQRGKYGMMLNILGGKREHSDADSAVSV